MKYGTVSSTDYAKVAYQTSLRVSADITDRVTRGDCQQSQSQWKTEVRAVDTSDCYLLETENFLSTDECERQRLQIVEFPVELSVDHVEHLDTSAGNGIGDWDCELCVLGELAFC